MQDPPSSGHREAPPRRVPLERAGARVDQVLAELFPQYSRARLQRWLRSGDALLDGARRRPADRVAGGEQVRLVARIREEGPWQAEDIALTVVHEDGDVIVVDKPPGLVVHPGAGNREGTLVNALINHDPALSGVPRAGIVHRLDKDTSGLMVVARTLEAHARLVAALKSREVTREYEALVRGVPTRAGRVDAPVGRDPRRRTRMAVTASGRAAATRFSVTEDWGQAARLRLRLETGRTHQIRVHMAHLGHPVLGDATYGGRAGGAQGLPEALAGAVARLGRQALHAVRLSLSHPRTGETVCWASPLPADIEALAAILRGWASP